MKRAITNVVLNHLSQKLLSSEIQAWDTVDISVDTNWKLVIDKGK
jgi:ATP-dependent Clp protease ATP-binding subunit ClpA